MATDSIQARIAALNLGHVGRAPGITANPIDDDLPPRPPIAPRRQTTIVNGHHTSNRIGNEPNGIGQNGVLPPPAITRTGQKKPPPPALPPRKQSSQPSPALPPRGPSGALQRRDSTASISSTMSSVSALSIGPNATAKSPGSRTPSMDATRKMAPVFDQTTLPPLPPKRTQEQVDKRYQDIERSRMGLKPTKSTPNVTTIELPSPPSLPSRPPQRPPQPPMRNDSTSSVRKLPPDKPPAMPARSALSFGMNKPQNPAAATAAPNGAHADTEPVVNGHPPPLPLSSKPDLSKLLATKPKPGAQQPQSTSQPTPESCLTCRDFSAPDNHAAKFPRQTVPSLDWLAHRLTSPFPASPTDQARAIFTWLHQNVAYDIIAFCNNRIQHSTPANTLSTGLAVCEGYASLFTALAAKAGLESLVVSGHGKGAGFSPLAPGEAIIPPESMNHAWNAVKIDNGEWKLIDACWGAGHVCLDKQEYTKKFAPRFFTMSNDEFGLRHFPENKSLFYRSNRLPMQWTEYILGPDAGSAETVRVCANTAGEEGIAESSVRPNAYHIPLSQPNNSNERIRFHFQKTCPHWSPTLNGPGPAYPYILVFPDGTNEVLDTDGAVWWIDITRRRITESIKNMREKKDEVTLHLCALDKIDGASARGMGVEETRAWFAARRAKKWNYQSLASWALV
ncbi:MAG: hypothetical protein LQ350_001068 [Teloschistes chrysophthalmus]|nr:MAG: hypothetical protein LQ350_001068 [Niorma chrysophthalma]